MKPFELVNASSLDSALNHVKAGATPKAAGIDLLDRLKEGLETPERLVNLATVPGLDSLADHPKKGLTVGPLVTLARLAGDPLVGRYPALKHAAAGIASPQIRNRATAAGNLCQRPRCWYFRQARFRCLKKGGELCYAQKGDSRYHALFDHGRCAMVHPSGLAVALAALGAQVQLMLLDDQGKKSARTVEMLDFFVAPEINIGAETVLQDGELVLSIWIPAPKGTLRSAYKKAKERQSADWPIAEVAVALEFEGQRCRAARVILGAAAPTPLRATAAEKLLTGASAVDEALAQRAAKAAMAKAKPLGSAAQGNAWRVAIFESLVAETIIAAARGGQS